MPLDPGAVIPDNPNEDTPIYPLGSTNNIPISVSQVDFVEFGEENQSYLVSIATAGEVIGISKILRSDVSGTVMLADEAVDVGDVIGVSISAVGSGQLVRFITFGSIPLDGITAGQTLYLGNNGDFSTTPSETGLFKIMGVCYTDNRLTLLPNPTIRRRVWP